MNNGSTFDPGHYHGNWEEDYDSGGMDGFCYGETEAECETAPSSYSYIQNSDVQPYFAIAKNYGFANYMFQTNEGPSFPAHQFLFTGTSAPVAPGVGGAEGYWWDFVRDNPPNADELEKSGCPYEGTNYPPAPWIDPTGMNLASQINAECYAHDSLVTGAAWCSAGICDKGVTWTYYSPTDDGNEGYIWNAPESIPEVCYGENDTNYAGQLCGSENGGTEWTEHMKFYSSAYNAPIFSDISSCNLASISWVIPDYAWSDHPSDDGTVSPPYGPSWVGNIVNAIGNSYAGSNYQCDYWGTSGQGESIVQPTAIFIVWDDWGGFYDHVSPSPYPNVWVGSPNGMGGWNCTASNAWGCGYTYGFRVPLLVVSEYTGTHSNGQYGSYVSGECGAAGYPSCPNNNFPYVHDFGSILAFTENNFGLTHIDTTNNGYADYNAPDWPTDHATHVPLSDFFQLSTGRPFIQIPVNYSPSFFESYYATYGATPTGPDTD